LTLDRRTPWSGDLAPEPTAFSGDTDPFVDHDVFKLGLVFETAVGPLVSVFTLDLGSSLEETKAAVRTQINALRGLGVLITREQVGEVMGQLDHLWTKDRKFRRRLRECRGE
jgi:hypothetical protein